MLIDALDLEPGSTLEADICIAGSGAAGITMARELARAGIKVLVLESGGFGPEADTQALYEGEMVGLKTWTLNKMRKREFGGTTVHWNGWVRPLSPDDFEARDHIQYSGWPIRYDDLLPFYEKASVVVQIGPFDFDSVARAKALELPLLPTVRDVETRYFQFSPPTRFGELYRDELVDSENVTVVLHANVVDVRLEAGNDQVSRLDCRTLEGTAFHATAKRYVLALGGLETPRVLLASRSQVKAGVANGHDVVGRYFMEHPHYIDSSVIVRNPELDYGFYKRLPSDLESESGDAVEVRGALALTAAARKREKLLNMTWPFSAAPPENTDTGSIAASALRALMGRHDREPTLALMNPRGEQSPHPDSRLTLTSDKDALGMPRIALDWRIAPEDDEKTLRSMRLIARELGAKGVGRMWAPRDGERYAWRPSPGGHHMGTARMGKDPKLSVVDANSRTHEVKNLYLAGSSVFTTAGDANPTLTVVALALRLADHLATLEAP